MAGFTALFFTAMVIYYALREHELVAQRLRADARLRRELRVIEDLAASCRQVPFLNEGRAQRPEIPWNALRPGDGSGAGRE
jgi:hypothetical protein